MKKNSQLTRIVLYQNLGFLGIMVLGFLDDLLQAAVADLFRASLRHSCPRRTTLEMLLVLVVWFLVSTSTRRILERVHYLEKFMRVCAWCRRINYQGEWMRLEEFMRQGFDTPTTHGICTECFSKQRESLEAAKQKQLDAKKEPVAK